MIQFKTWICLRVFRSLGILFLVSACTFLTVGCVEESAKGRNEKWTSSKIYTICLQWPITKSFWNRNWNLNRPLAHITILLLNNGCVCVCECFSTAIRFSSIVIIRPTSFLNDDFEPIETDLDFNAWYLLVCLLGTAGTKTRTNALWTVK